MSNILGNALNAKISADKNLEQFRMDFENKTEATQNISHAMAK
jgi:hypothetical protein